MTKIDSRFSLESIRISQSSSINRAFSLGNYTGETAALLCKSNQADGESPDKQNMIILVTAFSFVRQRLLPFAKSVLLATCPSFKTRLNHEIKIFKAEKLIEDYRYLLTYRRRPCMSGRLLYWQGCVHISKDLNFIYIVRLLNTTEEDVQH